MRIVSNNELAEVLREVQPVRIAAAYIGADFSSYLDIRKGQDVELVLSPTLGSNPEAIEILVGMIGWPRVQFLDRLHAKFYIGKNSALITSANLSQNGFEATGLWEIGILVEGEKALKRLNREFEAIRDAAQQQYSNSAAKKKALKDLRARSDAVKKALKGIPRHAKQARSPTFLDYDPKKHGSFKFGGWAEEGSLDTRAVRRLTGIADPDGAARDSLRLAPDDDVQRGDWLLVYRVNKDRNNAVSGIVWMHVDVVWQDCSGDKDYPHLAVELTAAARPLLDLRGRPQEPFKLSEDVCKAFTTAVREFPELLPPAGDDETWYVNTDPGVLRECLKRVRQELKRLSRSATTVSYPL